jgi:hypothetical protein
MAKRPSKAMANRGTFDATHTNYAKPIHHKVEAAVRPYVAKSRKATMVWGDTLVDCVPPAYALRYRELQGDLDAAMLADDYKLSAELATNLSKALDVMNAKARADGHKPPQVDGHICEWGDKIYCILASGDISALRRSRPNWVVYDMSEVCAIISARTGEMVAAVVNEFPTAKVTEVRLYDDEIPFGND